MKDAQELKQSIDKSSHAFDALREALKAIKLPDIDERWNCRHELKEVPPCEIAESEADHELRKAGFVKAGGFIPPIILNSEWEIKNLYGRSKYYKLDENNNPIACTRPEWEEMMKDDRKRRVAINQIGNIKVSTMFIGFDIAFHKDKPELYQTLATGTGEVNYEYEDQYQTYHEAVAGHLDICRALIHGNPL